MNALQQAVWCQHKWRACAPPGNYVLLEEEPWRQLRDLFDESWFVE